MNFSGNRPPADCSGGRGAGGNQAGSRPNHSTACRIEKSVLTVRLADDGPVVTFRGRLAQTLALLIARGGRGVTSGEASPLGWARRTSHYVMMLRRAGVPIASMRELTPDGARIARYTLCGSVVTVEGCAA